MEAKAEPLLLEARGVSVSFGGPNKGVALEKPFDFRLAAGEAVGLNGASGTGKTTLLRCLALLESRASGEVLFLGNKILDHEVPVFRSMVTYVAQTPVKFPLSVEQVFTCVCGFSNARGSYRRRLAESLLEQFGLPAAILVRDMRDLSGGEAQRVALVCAILVQPKVLLLDEPTASLDPQTMAAVEQFLQRWLLGENRALVVVSHKQSFIKRIATRVQTL